MLKAEQIMEYLPHRYPILLVDRILEFEAHRSIIGLKNVTIGEPYFQGHFPGHPIMPGVLILEAMAQVGGLLLLEEKEEDAPPPIVYLTSVEKAKWRRPVVPGDQMIITAELKRRRRTLFRLETRAEVDGEEAASAELSCHVVSDQGSS